MGSEMCIRDSVKLATLCHYPNSETVILSVSESPSICFSAAALAAAYEAPLLLIKPNHVPDSTMQELQRFSPNSIVIAGVEPQNEAIITAEILRLLDKANISFAQSTVAQEAAINIFHASKAKQWGDCAIVAWDGCFGDQMSLLPYSTREKAPVFYLDENDKIDDKTWSLLTSGHFRSLLLLGSEKTFPDEVIRSLHNNGICATRVCATNASAANAFINAHFVIPSIEKSGKSISTLIVSSTWHPFDSFNIGRYAIEHDAAMLLVDANNLDSVASAIQYLETLDGNIEHLVFIGDDNQFNRVDKRLLMKAAALAQRH